jgi:pre-mRNA branch site protein p14
MLTGHRSYNVTPEELFELFGKYGPIRYVPPPSVLDVGLDTDGPRSQVRQGIASNTKGTAFVVYEDVMDAKQACDKLNGFNFQGRYLVGES